MTFCSECRLKLQDILFQIELRLQEIVLQIEPTAPVHFFPSGAYSDKTFCSKCSLKIQDILFQMELTNMILCFKWILELQATYSNKEQNEDRMQWLQTSDTGGDNCTISRCFRFDSPSMLLVSTWQIPWGSLERINKMSAGMTALHAMWTKSPGWIFDHSIFK